MPLGHSFGVTLRRSPSLTLTSSVLPRHVRILLLPVDSSQNSLEPRCWVYLIIVWLFKSSPWFTIKKKTLNNTIRGILQSSSSSPSNDTSWLSRQALSPSPFHKQTPHSINPRSHSLLEKIQTNKLNKKFMPFNLGEHMRREENVK